LADGGPRFGVGRLKYGHGTAPGRRTRGTRTT
jgi:hypothetical protein